MEKDMKIVNSINYIDETAWFWWCIAIERFGRLLTSLGILKTLPILTVTTMTKSLQSNEWIDQRLYHPSKKCEPKRR